MTKKTISPAEAYNRIAAKCALGEQCSTDARRKLLDWGFLPEEAEAIINKLIAERFIDDERYAGAFARDKAKYQGWGKRKIAYQLHAKGMSQFVIEDALASIEDEVYANALENAIRHKAAMLSGKDYNKRRAALLRFAASRGYDLSESIKIINTLTSSRENDDDF